MISILILWKEVLEIIDEHKKKYSKLLSQKKSSEVVLGQISEQLAPFLNTFPVDDPQNLAFLGMPLDYVYFGNDKIVFIEVKSGKSRLSTKQRRLRNLIRDGKVEFIIHQIPKKVK
jgi:predicted Holliday junction resolvase-like endonuclease